MSRKKNPQPPLGFVARKSVIPDRPEASAARASFTNAPSHEMDYHLPKPTKEFVARINALAPDDSEFTVIEG